MGKELFFKVTVCGGIIGIALANILSPRMEVTVAVTAAAVCVLCCGAYVFFPAEREKTKRQVIAYSVAAITAAAATQVLPEGAAVAVTAVAIAIAFIAGRFGSGKKVTA